MGNRTLIGCKNDLTHLNFSKLSPSKKHCEKQKEIKHNFRDLFHFWKLMLFATYPHRNWCWCILEHKCNCIRSNHCNKWLRFDNVPRCIRLCLTKGKSLALMKRVKSVVRFALSSFSGYNQFEQNFTAMNKRVHEKKYLPLQPVLYSSLAFNAW